jgi:hypothetical protein
MPEIILPTDAYRKNGRFQVFEGVAKIEWGIKIHVAATQDLAQTIAQTALPILVNAKVRHKVLGTQESVAKDEQSKKFITIYPQSGDQLDDLLHEVDSALVHLQRGRILAIGVDKITGDLAYGYSGYVFTRYGNFLKDDKDDDRCQVSSKLFDYFVKDIDVFELSHHAKLAQEMGLDD